MANGNSTVLYPSKEPNISSSFRLENGVAQIKITGLREGDEVKVEVQVGDECFNEYIPYIPGCCQLCWSPPTNEFFLTVPNRYRFILTNRLGQLTLNPDWFDNVKIYYTNLQDVDVQNYIDKECAMGCCGPIIKCVEGGITIDGDLCAFPIIPDDIYLSEIVEAAQGFNFVLTDATVLEMPFTSSDDTVTIVGGDFVVNEELTALKMSEDGDAMRYIATGLCEDDDARNILNDCITGPTLCEQIIDLPVSATVIGG